MKRESGMEWGMSANLRWREPCDWDHYWIWAKEAGVFTGVSGKIGLVKGSLAH